MEDESNFARNLRTIPCLAETHLAGLSCRFPQSNSPSEFYENLISGEDLITEDDSKWRPSDYPELPARFGKLKEGELEAFDPTFFQIHGKLAQVMDPQLRKLLEVSWEAWIDSGIDVWALRHSPRVGVYTGSCGSEVQGAHLGDINKISGYEQLGCVQSMFANRLSYVFSFRGPSKQMDTACSSAALALHDALADISAGRTDYALVVGATSILFANAMMGFQRLRMLSPEGACKAFDAAGSGYARAEGVAAIVLKRADLKDVPRWAAISPYATILNAGTNNDGYTKEGITFPNSKVQLALEKQVCNGAGVNPADFSYVEAHGTGTVAGDGQELSAIDNWYGRAEGRTEPVLIGSVKSNMGHCEGASILASLIKICLSLDKGCLPGNLWYHRDTPNPSSAGLRDGTLKVVDENTDFKGGLIAVSSFGFGGSNVHVVMSGKAKERSQPLSTSSNSDVIPSTNSNYSTDGIIPLAARSASGLADLAKAVLECKSEGLELGGPLRRFANSAAHDLRMNHRGILANGELKSGVTQSAAPQVWFAFSGNGSQWSQMGLTLLRENATFRKSVTASAAVVKPLGVDLLAEFAAENGWKVSTLAALGLLSVQIGLVDTLEEDYGIVAAGMLGHSAGEIACTYASGCCTRTQALHIAFHRGRLPVDAGISGGLMAATGLSAEQALERTNGTKVVLACDNSPNSTTLSGPESDVRDLLKELDAEGVFARELTTNGVAWHSPVLDPLLPELNQVLSKLIPEPAKRPPSWVSACYPVDSKDSDAELSSAGYQVHSYRNPVLFTAAAAAIPNDAVIVEIGPHSILRSPLRQNRPDLKYVGAMRKGECAVQTLAAAVGELWRNGVPVKWKASPIPENVPGSEVPRSIREALVSWDRSVFPLPNIMEELAGGSKVYEKTFNLGGEHEYLCDHSVDGNVMLPMASFMTTAWEAFAKQNGNKTIWECPVEFLDVNVYQPVRAERGDAVTLGVALDRSTRFQVLHGTDVIMEGRIQAYDTSQKAKELEPMCLGRQFPGPTAEMLGTDPQSVLTMDQDAFYQDNARHNLNYGPKFQPVLGYGADRTFADIRWDADWIVHLDGIFQVANREPDQELHVAKGVRRLVIMDTLKDIKPGLVERLDVDPYWNICKSPSVLMEAFDHEVAPKKPVAAKTVVQRMEWVPYGERRVTSNPTRAAYIRQLKGLVKKLLAEVPEQDPHSPLLKIKAIVDGLPGQPLSRDEQEELTSSQGNKLASILAEVLTSEKAASELQDAILQHEHFDSALEWDPFLGGFGNALLEMQLLTCASNLSAAGFTVCEVGAGSAAFTKKTLPMIIESPQSTLIRYMATDAEDNSTAFAQSVAYKKLKYQAWDINKAGDGSPGPVDVIMASYLSHKAKDLPAVLSTFYNNINEGGFLFLSEVTSILGACIWGLTQAAWENTDGRKFGPCTSVEHWKQLLSQAGFAEVSTARCPEDSSAMFLYRKLPASVPRAFPIAAPDVHSGNEAMDAWLQSFLSTLDAAEPTEEEGLGTVWVCGDVQKGTSGVLGFMHSARKEPKGDRVRAVLNWGTADADMPELIERSRRLNLVNNAFKDGVHGAYLHIDADYQAPKEERDFPHGCHLTFGTYGNLKSVTWRENPITPTAIAKDMITCKVAFGALNFRDVMLASGKLSREQMLHSNGGDFIGTEFSGIVESTGKRVMGIGKNAIATKLTVPANLTFEVPQHWSLAEAASVPTAFLTSYYSLVMRGRLSNNMRVLIHSGTGAVGLASIQICLARGVEVFTTCGSASKRRFLLETFPQLREDHIGDSRSTSFEGLVRNVTGGKGVHLVLNSLSDDKLQASVRCLGMGGKLLEIGKYDILKGTPLSMKPLLQNIDFVGIDLDRVATNPDTHELDDLRKIMEAGLASGEVRPLPVTVFPRTEAEQAFRYLGQGIHIGKCLIDVSPLPKEHSTTNCIGPHSTKPSFTQLPVNLPPLKVKPQFSCRPDRSYIISGGVGGFGLALAEWLAACGAKHLVLTSKRGVRTGSQALYLRDLYNTGANFRVTKLDVALPEEVDQIIALAESMAPVGGIFHLAMTLTDKLLANQTGESWNACVAPKAIGAYNLDFASQKLPHLEHFVMWSSFVANAGNEGQTNYGFANACQDLLAEKRKEEGLPALSIQWGVIDNVGVADKRIQELMAGGLLEASMPQPIDDCLKLLGRLLCGGQEYGAVMSSHWVPLDLLGKSSEDGSKGLMEAVLGVLGMGAGSVSDTDTLPSLGMDSMQLVEVRAHLQRALGRPVPLEEISTMTIGQIKAMEETGAAATAAPAAAKAEVKDEATKSVPVPVLSTGDKPAKEVAGVPELTMMKEGLEIASSVSSLGAPGTPKKLDATALEYSRSSSLSSSLSPSALASPASKSSSESSTPDTASPTPGSPKKQVTWAAPESPPVPVANPPTAAATTEAVNKAAEPEAAAEPASESVWLAMSLTGTLLICVLLASVPAFAFRAAVNIAADAGVLAAALCIPALWLAAGFALTVATVVTKLVVMPQLHPGQPVKMWSTDFARWWLVTRLTDVATRLFMRHFRGTRVLIWFYRLMGAKIGQGAVIDTLDVMDFDFLEIGANAVIGQQATLLAHTFENGCISFSKVHIADNCNVQPCAVVTPATLHKNGVASGPLLTKESGSLAAATNNRLVSEDLTPTTAASLQVTGVLASALLVTIAAFAGYHTFACVLHWTGCGASLAFRSECYALAAMVALTSPSVAVYIPLMLQVASYSTGDLLALLPAAIMAAAAFPAAFAVYGVVLTLTAAALKSVLVGRMQPSVHKRNSSFGVRFWFCQHLVELCYHNVGQLFVGTWVLNSMYQLFGARIGNLSTVLTSVNINVPDMLKIGSHVHIGDTASVVTSIALDSQYILAASVVLEDQVMLGTSSAVLPGTSMGYGAALAPLSVTKPGASLPAERLCLGNPAVGIMKSDAASQAANEQNVLPMAAQRMHTALPYVQGLTYLGVVFPAVVLPAVAAQLLLMLLPGMIGKVLAVVAATMLHSGVANYLGTLILDSGPIYTDAGIARFSFDYFANLWSATTFLNVSNICDGLYKSSALWTFSLGRALHYKMGKRVYCDANRSGDKGLVEYGDDAVVDRGAVILAHAGVFTKGSGMTLTFKRTVIGAGAVVGPRAVVMPGCTARQGSPVLAGDLAMPAK